MELHVPTSGSPEKSLDPLEFLRPGYVQLHVAGNDIVDVFAKSRNGRPRLVLESLHRPYNQEQKRVKPPLKLNDISQCTKLHFVVRILNKIKALDMNQDIAIICHSPKIEKVLAEAMELQEMEYTRLVQFAPAKNAPFSGVLIRFRKKKQTPATRSHFRMRVDHILVYDAALSPPSATILQYFSGVYHDKPQIVLLVMLQSVDMRFCHFRDDHPHITIDPGKPLIQDKQGLLKLVENPKYKKITMVQRIGHNTAMLQRLIQWMVVRDGTVFDASNPINVQSTVKEAQLQKSIQDGAVMGEFSTRAIIITPTISPGIKRSIAEALDERNKRMKGKSKEENTLVVSSTVNTEGSPSTIPNTKHASAVEAESAGTAEEALYNGMFEFESALDEEYEKLKRLIYG